MDQLDFEGFDETDFEEFCFELLTRLKGFHNVDWRKGTPKASSPADRGRDIVAEVDHIDVDGSRHIEKWFVDCKHYARGVPPEALQGLLTWAHAERPHVALIIASGFLSNPAKDYLRTYEENNRPPFRIKYWERPILEKLARNDRELLERFLMGGMRTQSEVVAAEQEFFDKVWYDRHMATTDWDTTPREIYEGALQAAERVRERWGEENLGPHSDFEWG